MFENRSKGWWCMVIAIYITLLILLILSGGTGRVDA